MRHGKLSATARTGVLCLLGVAISIGWSTAATLTGMTVTAQGDVTRVKVMLDQPVEWSNFALSDPPRLYVDCRDVDTVLPKTLPAATGRVGKVEASVWKGDGYHALTRITLDLAGGTASDVKAIDGGLLITLGPAGTTEWMTTAGTTGEGTSTDSMAAAGTGTSTPPSTGAMTGTEEMTPAEAAGMTEAAAGGATAETAPETTPAATPDMTGSTPAETATRTEAPAETGTETTVAPESTETMSEATPETPEAPGAAPSAAPPTSNASTTAGETGTAPETTPAATGETSTTADTGTTPAPAMTPESSPAATATTQTPASTGETRPNTETPAANETPAPATPAAAPSSTEETAASELTPAEESLDYSLPDAKTQPEAYAGHREPEVADFPLSKPEGLAGRGGARVSLDIQGADIYTVLRSISEYSGVNIVMGYDVRQKVKDPVSFHLENVPWGEALEMVLRSAHLWYRDEGNVVRVDTEENLRNEELARSNADRQLEDVMPLTTRIVEVIYAHAGELKPTVEKSLSRRGVVTVDERTNSLVVTDIRARVDAAADMIRHLDSQTPQVEIVAKLVDVDAKATRELGVLWTGDNTGSNGDISITNARLGSNTVTDPTVNVKFGLVKSWGSVNATISALEKENKANIISNPRITTVNNREARILVGQKIPLIILDEAGNPITQLTTIGIALRVTPHINDQNRITLDLHPEVSDLASQATVQGGVIINTSEADTRVMVENGQTAVIGGLIRANDTKLVTGVPILKDVPLIGAFFSDTSKIREKRELLIFVTPRIISSFAAESSN